MSAPRLPILLLAAAAALVAPRGADGQTAANQAAIVSLSDQMTADDAVCGVAAARETGRCLAVRIDHLRRLTLPEPVGALLIGNPAIADVTLISPTEAVITAKSVGTTNMIFIDQNGGVLADLEILVLESADRRVVLRRGPSDVASYQCAPRCERTLSLNDSPDAHSALSGVISSETSMISEAASQGAADEGVSSTPE